MIINQSVPLYMLEVPEGFDSLQDYYDDLEAAQETISGGDY